MKEVREIILIERLGTYVPDEAITKVEAAILQLELRNIQALLINLTESLIDSQR